MAANSLSYTYTDATGDVAIAAGWNRTAASWTSVQTGDFARINKAAMRQVCYPEPLDGERTGHIWSWRRIRASLTLNAPYSTGTVAVSGTGVTGTDTVWPTWAASADLWVDGGRYSVASRTNDTALVLDSSAGTIASGTSYTLIQHYYDLPSDYDSMDSNGFIYRRDQTQVGWVRRVGEGDLWRAAQPLGVSGTPCLCAIIPVAPTSTNDARWQVVFEPVTSQELVLEYSYLSEPPALDATPNIYHYGGPAFSEVFRLSFIDQTYQLLRGRNMEVRGAFLSALRQAVMHDRKSLASDTLGYGAQSPGRPSLDNYDALRARRSQITDYEIVDT